MNISDQQVCFLIVTTVTSWVSEGLGRSEEKAQVMNCGKHRIKSLLKTFTVDRTPCLDNVNDIDHALLETKGDSLFICAPLVSDGSRLEKESEPKTFE